TGALRLLDAVAGTTETNTWAGSVSLTSGTDAVRVDGGGASPDRLTFVGVVGGTGALVKLGPGELELGGTAPNVYTGATTVNEGTLRLNKSGGTSAASAQAYGTGDLTV